MIPQLIILPSFAYMNQSFTIPNPYPMNYRRSGLPTERATCEGFTRANLVNTQQKSGQIHSQCRDKLNPHLDLETRYEGKKIFTQFKRTVKDSYS